MDSATVSHSDSVVGKTNSCKSKAHLAIGASCSEIFRLSVFVSLWSNFSHCLLSVIVSSFRVRFLPDTIILVQQRQTRETIVRLKHAHHNIGAEQNADNGTVSSFRIHGCTTSSTSLNLSNKHPDSNVEIEAPSTAPGKTLLIATYMFNRI